ncbi:MAG: ABC transporter ATP-binding protein [Alphaproteobacteria bacterium]|nr:ABC transporter ATP-binding protein [Alphaproteobacteria bacterium]
MLRLVDITYRIAGRVILDRASAHVPAGHRIGLVGRNGAGKTTLLRLVMGEIAPDSGDLGIRRTARIGMIAQEAPGGDTTPLQAVLAADRERSALLAEVHGDGDPERLGDLHDRLRDIGAHTAPSRAATILAGLGFDDAGQARPLSSFSGGWRMRVALAAALFAEPDLLLLDEPTNHLDLEAAIWLESFLRRYPRTMVVVSHDRHFLNAVIDRVLHLEGGKLTLYEGDFDTFERTREERLANQAAARAKQEARRKHMQAFVDRFRYKASKARQAQSRLKAIARMPPIPEAQGDSSVTFQFPRPDDLAPPLIAIDGAAVGYEDGKPVLARMNLRIDPDDRIALLGANGNGKSTFAKMLAGRLQPMAGEVRSARRMRVGFFAQHQIDDLVPAETPFQHVLRLLPRLRPEGIRNRLGRFGFGGDAADVPVSGLSGGEKARLTLCLVALAEPHLLILDEPTNHLDMAAREALIEGLNDFPGAVIIVSHDRHLIELVADQLWLVSGGGVRPFDGDLDDYRAEVLGSRGERSGAAKAPRKGERRRGAVARAEVAPLRRALKDAEAAVERLTAEKRELERRLADPTTYGKEGGPIAALARRQASLTRDLATAEVTWLAAQDELERAQVEE